MPNQIVSQWSFFWSVAKKHADDLPHIRFDLNNENFFIVPNENRATAVHGQNPTNFHRQDITLHVHSLRFENEKTSLTPTRDKIKLFDRTFCAGMMPMSFRDKILAE